MHGSRKEVAEVNPFLLLHTFVWSKNKVEVTSTIMSWILYGTSTFQDFFTRILDGRMNGSKK